MSAATEARPRAGERVRMQVARGWHRPWPLRLGGGDSDDLFVPRGGWRPARVLAEHDPENAAFLVVVDAAGRVWRMVNPACVRADVAVVAEPRVLVIEAEDGDLARVVASHLIAAGYWTELVRDGARYEVRTLASREPRAARVHAGVGAAWRGAPLRGARGAVVNARSHEVVAILARHIAAAADTAPVDADDTSIVDVALDAAHADLVTLLGREAADRVVSAEHVVGSIFYAGVCEHLLAFHRAHGGAL